MGNSRVTTSIVNLDAFLWSHLHAPWHAHTLSRTKGAHTNPQVSLTPQQDLSVCGLSRFSVMKMDMSGGDNRYSSKSLLFLTDYRESRKRSLLQTTQTHNYTRKSHGLINIYAYTHTNLRFLRLKKKKNKI